MDDACKRLRFAASDLRVMLGDDAIFEDVSCSYPPALRLFGEGYLEDEDRREIGIATLTAYFGTRVEKWQRGGIVWRDQRGFMVVINADEAFGPTFPAMVGAIVARPADWQFLLSIPGRSDLKAPGFKDVQLVSAAINWESGMIREPR